MVRLAHQPRIRLRRSIGFVTQTSCAAFTLCLGHPVWALDAASGSALVALDAPGGAVSSDEVEEIIITGRHRSEKAQDVPIGITAITSAQIEANPAQLDLKEIEAAIPSLQIEGYSGRNQTLQIRGLGSAAGNTNDGLEQGVGLYIDGIYYARTGTALKDLTNIQSIDVYRGPQGTLFGKNTVAGAIDIQTKAPSFEFGGEASVSGGNYGYFNGQAVVTGPITDVLAAQLVVDKTNRDGLVYNAFYHEGWDDRNELNGRVDLLYQPSATFKYRLGLDFGYQIGNVGFLSPVEVLPTTLANGSVVRGFYTRAAQAGYTPLYTITPFSRTVDINSSQYDEYPAGGFTGRGDWKLGDVTLTSITGYREFRWLPNFDGDFTGADVLPESIVITHQQQVSQEFRVTSASGGEIDYTGGLYYWWQKDDDQQRTIYGSQASQWINAPNASAAALNPATLSGLGSYAHVEPVTNSYSVFGQATWHIHPDLSLTAGLRYTFEHKDGEFDETQQGSFAPLSSFPLAQQATVRALRNAYAPTYRYTTSSNDGEASGTLSLGYKILPDVLTYASFSHGFKAAGLNLAANALNGTPGFNTLVQPEEVDDYEIGAKTTLFDRKLTLDGDVFWTNDRHYQTNTITYPVGGPGTGFQYIGNVPLVRTRGVELDAKAAPIPGLSVTLSAIYDEASYVSFPDSTCTYLNSYTGSYCTTHGYDESGRPLTGTPRWSGSLSWEYNHVLPGYDQYIGYFGGDWHYQSGLYSAVNDDPFSRIAAYAVGDLHLGARTEDGWDAEFWVRNVLDKNYYNTKAVSAGSTGSQLVVAAYGEPRTFGFTLRKTF